MTEPSYEEGDEFHLGSDGRVRIEDVYSVRESEDKVVYEVKYLDHEGQPVSTLSEQLLEEVN